MYILFLLKIILRKKGVNFGNNKKLLEAEIELSFVIQQ